MSNTAVEKIDHWYYHRWPWALMLIPFAAVIFGIFMVTTALYFPDDVVVDTYYKDGKAINQIIALDEAAKLRGLQATLSAEPTADRFVINLNTDTETVLHLFAYHVTDSSADREFLFLPDTDNSYSIQSAEIARILSSTGVWYLELRGDNNDWRLRTRALTPVSSLEF
jgi:uncharacterized protein